MDTPSLQDTQNFQKYLLHWYTRHGRFSLPWRVTHDPYHVLVSELMLQQTQVERVIPKYEAFLKQFPTIKQVAEASLAEVLQLWQGLGYNRRAKYLHAAARELHFKHNDTFPSSTTELQKLPGIGPYTASAIAAFAFNKPVVVIETNIRTVFLYHFFPGQSNIADLNLIPLIEQSIYKDDPRSWYSALMDYGSWLKKNIENSSRRSKHHTVQSRFKGSVREVRGSVLRILSTGHKDYADLLSQIDGNTSFLPVVLEKLLQENLISLTGNKYHLPC